MFNKKQIYVLTVLLLVLGLVFVQKQVFAQWANPGSGPGSGTNLNFLENPLAEDLNLGTHNITGATNGVFSGNVSVGTLNGMDPADFVSGEGFITNPLSEDLAGGKHAISNLASCDPAKDTSCAGVTAIAGKNSFNNTKTFSFGVWGSTDVNSGVNPSYGVYGSANNSGGFGVVGTGNDVGSGIYGYANAATYAGYFRNDNVSGVALGVLGSVATDLNGGEMTVVDGGNNILSLATTQTTITGNVIRSGGDNGFYSIGNEDSFAGISAIGGEVGLFGSGPIGVLGEGYYGGVFNGQRASGWNPPPPGGGGNTPPSENPLSRLFGLNQTLASTNDPGYIGLVTTGGYTYSGGFSTAGLGLCTVSGELVHDDLSDNDYFTYCQDAGGRNNYSGFFAGDVYIKKGSIQINDTLAANENLIYGNSASAASGSYLIKLQALGSDKFKVDKDGNLTTTLASTGNVLGQGMKIERGTGFLSLGQGTSNGSNFLPILKAKAVGDTGFFIRGIQSDTQVNSEAFRFSVSNSSENGAIPATDLAVTFYNWATPLMSILGNGNVGIGTITPSDPLTVTGNTKLNGDLKFGSVAAPTCNAGNTGIVHYFGANKTLCMCNGNDWDSLVNQNSDSFCSNNPI